MATKQWLGAAMPVSQVTRVTFSAYTSGVTYTLTCNAKTVSYTAVASTSADVWGGLVAAWNASTYAEHVEAIASESSGVLLTSRTAGTPFTVTGSSSAAPTATVAAVTAASGPNSFTAAANWVGGVAPTAGDDLLFKDSAVSVLYDLENTGTDYGDITVEASFTGRIGLPETNLGGYPEYRPRHLKLGGGTNSYAVVVGQGSGRFPEAVLINANSATVLLSVYGGGSGVQSAVPVQLKNCDASSTAAVYGGSAGVYADTSGGLTSASVVAQANSNSPASLVIGEGVTVADAVCAGGSLTNYGTITTLAASGGAQVSNYGSMPAASASTGANVAYLSSSGASDTVTAYTQGVIDFSREATAKTVDSARIHQGGSILDPLGVVTWTNGVELIGCRIADCTLDLGRDIVLNTVV